MPARIRALIRHTVSPFKAKIGAHENTIWRNYKKFTNKWAQVENQDVLRLGARNGWDIKTAWRTSCFSLVLQRQLSENAVVAAARKFKFGAHISKVNTPSLLLNILHDIGKRCSHRQRFICRNCQWFDKPD
jgi:hypothetical protein